MPERLRKLAELSAELGTAVTVDDVARGTLREIASVDGVVRAGLALAEGGGRELRFVSSDDDGVGPGGVRWCGIDGLADLPLAQSVRSGEPVWLRGPADIAAEFPDIAERQRQLGTRSLAAVPLLLDGTPVGGLLVAYGEEDTVGRPEVQAFLVAVAAQVAQAVRRGLAYQVQHSTAEQLQRSLMPHSLPDVPGLAIGAHYAPGGVGVDVGGDWYDVLELDDGSVAFGLGDVMGKGVAAAIVMGELRAAARAYALTDPDPAAVAARLDRVVEHLQGADHVVTLLLGLVSPARDRLTLCVAGHPPPLLVTPSGRPRVLDDPVGPALGLGVGVGPWPTIDVPLEDRTAVLLYSDGLVETRTQDLFEGVDRLCDVVADLAPRRRNPRELCARLGALMTDGRAEDDVTVLAVTAAPAQRRAVRELPGDQTAPSLGRRFVGDVLGAWSVDADVVENAVVCTSELVTNAVIHAGTPSTVTVEADAEYVVVSVQDRGGRGAVRRMEPADAQGVSGRGLALVEALTHAWNTEHSADGTTVWFELALSGAVEEPAGDPWTGDLSAPESVPESY